MDMAVNECIASVRLIDENHRKTESLLVESGEPTQNVTKIYCCIRVRSLYHNHPRFFSNISKKKKIQKKH